MANENVDQWRDFFVYTFFTPALNIGESNKPLSITIQNDAKFLWQKFSYFVSADVGGVPTGSTTAFGQCLPEISIQITDSSSGRYMSNVPVQLSSICGDGKFPFILPEPKVLVEKTTMIINVSNYSATENYTNLYINMIGTKVFIR